MKLSAGTKLAIAGIGALVFQAVFDASRAYFKADLTPTASEWIRYVGVAVLCTVLYGLRSPKDASTGDEQEQPEDQPR